MASEEEIIERFSFHKVGGPDAIKMKAIRAEVRRLAVLINESCPENREKATALTQLFFVMASANHSIAIDYPLDPEA